MQESDSFKLKKTILHVFNIVCFVYKMTGIIKTITI